MPIAYQDGSYVERSNLSLTVADFGFSRGIAVFDLARVYGGKPFHLDGHLARFANSAKALNLDLPVDLAELSIIANTICEKNKYAHSAVKFYLTAGEPRKHPHSFAEDQGFSPHLFVLDEEVAPDHPEAPYGFENYKRGQKIKTVLHERILPSLKTTCYLQAYVAARQEGLAWDDILFTHHEGYVTEVSRGNFFCVIDGVLCTPARGMLGGITRNLVLELAEEAGIKFSLCDLTPQDLTKATEAFTCGTVAELNPIRQINDTVFAQTMDAPVFQKLRRGYTNAIARAVA